MSLSTGRGKLFNAMKVLKPHWEQVKEIWNDPVRQDFEENFWNHLDERVEATLRATDRLDQVLLTMRRDCSTEREE